MRLKIDFCHDGLHILLSLFFFNFCFYFYKGDRIQRKLLKGKQTLLWSKPSNMFQFYQSHRNFRKLTHIFQISIFTSEIGFTLQ